MVKTTTQDLGEAYERALMYIYREVEPLSPRAMGAAWRELYGLYHRYESSWNGNYRTWIEFPNDGDYTAFMLRWS